MYSETSEPVAVVPPQVMLMSVQVPSIDPELVEGGVVDDFAQPTSSANVTPQASKSVDFISPPIPLRISAESTVDLRDQV